MSSDPISKIASSISERPELITQQKFIALAQRFEGFERDILLQKNKKRDDDEKRIIVLHEELEVIKISIKEEEKRRIETMKALRLWYEDKFNNWKTEVEAPIYIKFEDLQKELVKFEQRFEVIEAAMEVDRTAVQRTVESAVEKLTSQLTEFQARYKVGEKERDRKEEEARILSESNLHKMTLLFETERAQREASLSVLKQNIVEECVERRAAMEVIKSQNVEQIAQVKQAVLEESRSRVAVEEELTKQIQHYAAALQDAIKNMM